MRLSTALFCCLAIGFAAGALAREGQAIQEENGVPGVTDAELDVDFWLRRAANPDAVLISSAGIVARNQELLTRDDSMHDLARLPATLERSRVLGLIENRSSRPQHPLYDEAGQAVNAATIDAWMAALAIDAIPESQPTRFGLVVQRSALRSFPTKLRVFSEAGETDIDRLQESALFPGTPVAILHQSRDGQWLFVLSPRYAAWIEATAVAQGPRNTVLAYPQRVPFRVITGDEVKTVFSREQPALSQLALDMSVRLPLAASVSIDEPINGQTPYTSWVLDMPTRQTDGQLRFAPALLQKVADSRGDFLPLTRANLLRQAFKFLGERYGWGHSYDGRDCSGFVSDVYRSMGLLLPRNTSDQAVSPAFPHQRFDQNSSTSERQQAINALAIGDLIYIPGHVMMVIGQAHGQHYVIHDVNGMRYRKADGRLHAIKLNAVSVTPLEPLMFNATERYIDRMTSIVRPYGSRP